MQPQPGTPARGSGTHSGLSEGSRANHQLPTKTENKAVFDPDFVLQLDMEDFNYFSEVPLLCPQILVAYVLCPGPEWLPEQCLCCFLSSVPLLFSPSPPGKGWGPPVTLALCLAPAAY